MAVSRFNNLAEYTAFDPYIPTEADMYAKVRGLETNALLAKQQTDQALHDKLGETSDLLSVFEPSKTYTTYLGDKARVDNPSRLYPLYQQKVSDIYSQQQALIDKHADNLSTPEAQRDFNKFQGYLKNTLGELKQIKESDKIRQKSEEDINKSLADSDVGNIGGAIFPYNASMDAQYGLNSQMGNVYNNTPIAGTKVVDVDKKIDDYIGTNKIRTIKDDYLNKLGIKTIADAISVIEDGSTSIETKRRSRAQLKGLADAYLNSDRSEVINNARQIQYDSIRRGNPLDDQTALKQAEDQVLRRFYQFDIKDSKTDRNRSIKQLSTEDQKALGKGIYDPLRNVSIIENPLMDSNVAPEVFELDSKGNPITKKVAVNIRPIGGSIVGTGSNFQGTDYRTTSASKPEDYSGLLYGDDKNSELFRSILSAEGVNIVGDVKSTDIPKIQKALKDNRERVYNNMQLATNGYDAVQLNTPKLDQTLSNQLNASTLRFNKDQTLPEDLPKKDTKTGSLDGSKFNEWLSTKQNVKIQTDNILAGTGQLGKPLGFKRTVLYQDEKGGTVKKLDVYQDSPFKDVNDNPYYNALNEITRYTSSGKDASQIKIPTYSGEFIFELKRTPNNQKKTYDYSGRVFDPNSGTWESFDQFKKDVSKGALLDVLKNSEGVGRNFTNNDINQIEALYNNTEQ